MARSKVEFSISYFNPNGTHHFTTRESWDVQVGENGQPNMVHAMAKLRGLRDSGGQMGMPGELDEGWPGPILLECEGAAPQLLMPYQTDYERVVCLLTKLKIAWDEEHREQRVVVQRLPEREGLAELILKIDSGVGRSNNNTTFYFNGAGKFLSYATCEEDDPR